MEKRAKARRLVLEHWSGPMTRSKTFRDNAVSAEFERLLDAGDRNSEWTRAVRREL